MAPKHTTTDYLTASVGCYEIRVPRGEALESDYTAVECRINVTAHGGEYETVERPIGPWLDPCDYDVAHLAERFVGALVDTLNDEAVEGRYQQHKEDR